MSVLESKRALILAGILCMAVAAAAIAVSTSVRGSRVLAAKRVTAAEDARAAAQPSSPLQHHNGNPVIVELFTSEGCSSCPPADALLARLQQDQPVPSADIITLEEHVDYWDHLGWKDRFSSPNITRRQQSYARQFRISEVYTPQFVVNGSAQFDGTDPSAINAAIAEAAVHTLPFQISAVHVRNGMYVSFKLADIPALQRSRVAVVAAVVEPHETSNIKKGENAGRILHHVDTVRAINAFLPASSDSLSKQSFSLRLPDTTRLANPRLIVFVRGGTIAASAVHAITNKEIDGLSPDTAVQVFSTIPGDPVTSPVIP